MRSSRKASKSIASSFLDGQLLIAMPTMTDRRFQRSVVFMCMHSTDGAMGLIINQRASKIGFPDLLKQLDIGAAGASKAAESRVEDMTVHVGGPVSSERGFVLHSRDYFVEDSSMTINGGYCLTATVDILRAIASGKGPERSILALGYAGWSPGQLENEIQANGWLHCPADPEIVFDCELDEKYTRALGRLGIDPTHLSSAAGHA